MISPFVIGRTSVPVADYPGLHELYRAVLANDAEAVILTRE